MRLRDRDSPISQEGLIFRVYGYDHPEDSCFCDLEYAPEEVYTSGIQKSVRTLGNRRFFKFYFDEGLKFVHNHFPEYQVFHKHLREMLVGLREDQIIQVVRPDERLKEILISKEDPLIEELNQVLELVLEISSLDLGDFGVFGSIFHGFHSPKFSDIDLIVYGKRELKELREALKSLYSENLLSNEFDDWTVEMPPLHWNFSNYSKKEYGWHQKRKLIYATRMSKRLGRRVKIEFEPVRRWDEIRNEYEETLKIEKIGTIEATVKVISDEDSGFMPSVYSVEALRTDPNVAQGVERVVSYMEEFRLQLETGEIAQVIGRLEKVEMKNRCFNQITLSQGEGYFEQIIKLIN
ncbi:nucleotidyltransferase domain-containing protein [Candidatus Bathyarchaeota archaeon]|nr:nucleotidyltransferase domain-containing protein [Candidatus Bathyarchaeota archaeon]